MTEVKMVRVKYVGPHAAVENASVSLSVVQRNHTVEVPAHIAQQLCKKNTDWTLVADATPTKNEEA